VADQDGCQIVFMLELEPEHWRRHDRAFWAQTLATAVESTAPDTMRVENYELQDTKLLVRAKAKYAPKAMWKLLSEDEKFLRLRARLIDLGAHPKFEIRDDG
jgi:hypothetical protein